MKKLLTGIFLFGFVLMSSAQDLNNYKYIIVPETFSFTDGVDQYRLNSLTKFLFEKNGFNTVMKTEDKPVDLKNDPCLGLNTNITDNSNLFVTKLTLQLIDCGGNVVFETKEGSTRAKDFKTAYHEALRDAFSTVETLEYKYVESATMKEESSEKGVVAAPTVSAKESENKKDKVGNKENAKMDSYSKANNDISEINIEEREFLYSEKTYSLKVTAQGLGLFQENSSDPIAILIETNGGESYIYNSLTNQGVAYYDDNGNLIVEYFNKLENKKSTLLYKLKN